MAAYDVFADAANTNALMVVLEGAEMRSRAVETELIAAGA
jgi:hypothetical protein